MSAELERAWEAESLRLCDRYVEEVVLAFDLCPWAEPALRAGRVGRAVCLSLNPTPADCLPFIDDLRREEEGRQDGRQDGPKEIGLLIFPRHSGGRSAFDTFAERVRRAMAPAEGGCDPTGSHAGSSPRFLVAAFHPGGAETFVGPHQLVSFLRRTPDPLLQFVLSSVIDRVQQSQPDASETVARRNHQALLGAGAAALDEVTRAIQADREATHARLARMG